jgi:phospholipid transport system substrate-binding protein
MTQVQHHKDVNVIITQSFIGRIFRRCAIAMLVLTAAIALSVAPSRCLMQAGADDPMAVVKTTVNQAMDVLRDSQSPLAQRQDKLREIVAATFDFSEMSKSALGYHWKQITPDQQKEFTSAFRVFIEDSYLSKINEYRGQQVAFLTLRNDGPQYTQVNTDIIDPSGQDPVQVNYQLLQEGGSWKIYDVTVDAISIMANYRNQFNRVVNNSGYDTLIGDLKSKQAALESSLANH